MWNFNQHDFWKVWGWEIIGLNYFGLWCLKMHALLVQQGILIALRNESKLDASMTEKDKKTLLEKTPNVDILSLGDKVLRLVSKERSY